MTNKPTVVPLPLAPTPPPAAPQYHQPPVAPLLPAPTPPPSVAPIAPAAPTPPPVAPQYHQPSVAPLLPAPTPPPVAPIPPAAPTPPPVAPIPPADPTPPPSVVPIPRAAPTPPPDESVEGGCPVTGAALQHKRKECPHTVTGSGDFYPVKRVAKTRVIKGQKMKYVEWEPCKICGKKWPLQWVPDSQTC
ncbi:vegetative cell wall protein gp1-like [Myripristis murdjan]|uniref:vegetative cell wall protein gp1-like n=1 Tax=Myripristis murdjan TaxID=586833 RepID=UPI001176429C|nr:vegetative cell wall protein gp1-like [Myripristis murdjan]